MMAMKKRGVFIVFEGIDGGGKSTQIKLISEYLKERGYELELHMEPTEGEIGRLLWSYMRSKNRSFEPETEALLFAADRIAHGKAILKAMGEGKHQQFINLLFKPGQLLGVGRGVHGLAVAFVMSLSDSLR